VPALGDGGGAHRPYRRLRDGPVRRRLPLVIVVARRAAYGARVWHLLSARRLAGGPHAVPRRSTSSPGWPARRRGGLTVPCCRRTSRPLERWLEHRIGARSWIGPPRSTPPPWQPGVEEAFPRATRLQRYRVERPTPVS
jgi:hypothetical protein